MDLLSAYIPIDRRHAIARGETLRDRTYGAALFADISGFTPLTEALAQELGPRRGAEELTHQLNAVYTSLVSEVHMFHGSVIGFAGDAVTCWFEGDDGLRAVSAALAMQASMKRFHEITTPGGNKVNLAIKTAVTVGPVRRFLIGDPKIQLIDVLAGNTLARMAAAEHMAERGDVIVTADIAQRFHKRLELGEWRTDEEGERYATVHDIVTPITLPPWPRLPRVLGKDELRPWLLPPVYNRLQSGQDTFLAELRPAVTLFLRFGGIDYDTDDRAGDKLNQYVSWVQNVLNQYEGFLLQLIMGDKGSYLYAAFGAPISHGDDTARAIAAALDLQQPPAKLSFIDRAQIGISQGRMRTGAYGGIARQTYGVLGDEVNTSARLMQQAKPGQVLVSPPVVESTRRIYQFRALGEIALKGKAEPLPVAEVIGRLEGSHRTISTSAMHLLLGRESTLNEMDDIVELASRGQGQILRIEGPAGIGKSHLAYAFNDRARRGGVRVIMSACQSTTQATPYYPWRQIFRTIFDMKSTDDTAYQIARVEAAVKAINPDWELRLPLMGDLLGLPIPENAATAAFDPRLRQEALFTLAIEIVQHYAEQQTLLLFVDDMHWMDEASLDLTVALGRALSQHAVLLLLMHRPPLDETKPILPALNELANHYFISLGELPPAAIKALAASKLGGPIAPLASAVIQSQAQGNPFFAEELVQALRESGQLLEVMRGGKGVQWELAPQVFDALQHANCLYKQEGEWLLKDEVTLTAVDLGVPDSIHGIVLSRLDRLQEDENLTIKVASVIGRLFEFDLLHEAHPSRPTAPRLLNQITSIENRDFLRLETPEPRRSYIFKHNTMQEVAYNTLLFAQRRELHRTIARWYEKTFGGSPAPDNSADDPLEPFYPLLAFHWRYAEDATKERRYAMLAAEQAAAQFANEDALRYFTRALKLTPDADLEVRYRLLLGREEIYSLMGLREEQAADLAELHTLAQQLGQANPILEVELRYVNYYEETSNYPEAQKRAYQALGMADQAQSHEYRINILNALGQILLRQGQLAEARQQLMSALELARKFGNRQAESTSLHHLGTVSFYLHEHEAARQSFEEAISIRRELGNLKDEAITLNNLAVVNNHLGSLDLSAASLQQALAIHQAVGNRRYEASTLNNLNNSFKAVGDFAAAQSYAEQSLNLFRALGDRRGESEVISNLGLINYEIGNYQASFDYCQQSLALDQEIGDRYGETYSSTYLALALEGLGRFDEAYALHEAATTMRREMDQAAAAIDNVAGLARIALKTGQLPLALQFVEEITTWLAENGVQGIEYPLRVYLTAVSVLQAAERREQASAMLAEAHAILQTQAQQIGDQAIREAFLSNVPLHRELSEQYLAQNTP